jgi:hypothetical protein
MRFLLPVLASSAVIGAAAAQPAPPVTIEDDVSPANGVKCAGLRMAQSEVKPDALITAARDAWLKSGVDAEKAKAEAAKMATSSEELRAAISDECAPFEIKSARSGG